MSDNIYRTQIRFPNDLAAKLKEAARNSERSFNSEVVGRLERSLREDAGATTDEESPVEMITPEEARELAETSIDRRTKELFNDCLKIIKERASYGSRTAYCELERDLTEKEAEDRILEAVVRKLRVMGYEVVLENLGITIKF